MSPRRGAPSSAPFAGHIVDVPIAEELSDSFLAYSLSVITSRAIPDVRDGLKPVQRRLLFSMLRMGLRPDSPHRKCARVVGDTMGKYHPHGDAAIYDALVRMGQDFSRGIPLVDPQGNFGTLDDPPAAARYTECRLSGMAMEMLAEIDEETVDFRLSYDGEAAEPGCLPARLPNLLVNGTSGIAVGMATSMPPHNLREVCEAVRLQMADPDVPVEALMAVMAGPDFPSGGTIVTDGLADTYTTGRGTIRVRAHAEILDIGHRRQAIRITELPWLVGPEKVVAKVKELAAAERLEGIEDIKNLSDRHKGVCIQVRCRPGVDAAAVLSELWRLSPIEESVAINNVVLANGTPVTAGLKNLIAHYIDHRLNVIVRRTNHRACAAETRLHLLDGLLAALDNIDDAVTIIRSSPTAEQAQAALCDRLNLSETQADAVLAMRLRRLVALERDKIVAEHDKLSQALLGYRELLESRQRQRDTVIAELAATAEQYGTPRRTRIVSPDEAAAATTPIGRNGSAPRDATCQVVTLSNTHIVGRGPAEPPGRRARRRHDVLTASVPAADDSIVWAFTSSGDAMPALTGDLPEVAGRSRGADARDVFGLPRSDRVRGLLTMDANAGDEPSIIVATSHGNIKRLSHNDFAAPGGAGPEARQVIALADGEELVGAFSCAAGTDIALVSSDGSLLRTAAANIPARHLAGAPSKGMRLRPGSRLLAAADTFSDAQVFAVTTTGAAKSTPIGDFPTAGRGGMGVRICKLRDGETLRSVYVGTIADAYVLTGTRPSSPDNEPAPFPVLPTRRGLATRNGPQPILAVGQKRW